jgi:hypothetical protein
VAPVPPGFGRGAATPGKPALRLPADPNAVVFRLDRTVDSATAPGMVLTIHANGRVVAEVQDGLFSLAPQELTRHAQGRVGAGGAGPDPEPPKSKVLEGRLSARELEDLLRFTLHEQEFFDFDPAAVKAAIRDKYQSDGEVTDPTDATTTGFRVRTADQEHEVRWTRLAKSTWDFPDVGRLLQLSAVDKRLSQVYYALLAGGPERVEAVVEKMNELALPNYRLYPGAPRLRAEDLVGVAPSADGSRTRFTFFRIKDKTACEPLFGIAIDVPQQGEPTLVFVMPPQQGRRYVRTPGSQEWRPYPGTAGPGRPAAPAGRAGKKERKPMR